MSEKTADKQSPQARDQIPSRLKCENILSLCSGGGGTFTLDMLPFIRTRYEIGTKKLMTAVSIAEARGMQQCCVGECSP